MRMNSNSPILQLWLPAMAGHQASTAVDEHLPDSLSTLQGHSQGIARTRPEQQGLIISDAADGEPGWCRAKRANFLHPRCISTNRIRST